MRRSAIDLASLGPRGGVRRAARSTCCPTTSPARPVSELDALVAASDAAEWLLLWDPLLGDPTPTVVRDLVGRARRRVPRRASPSGSAGCPRSTTTSTRPGP